MISIIVPVFQVERYLKRCIDSILDQSFTDFELILVDDGSPDNCGTICEQYSEKDNRIHVIHKENSGLSDARNVGINWAFENSDSKWIAFIDSDDWVHCDYLKILFEAVKTTGCDISICGFVTTNGVSPIIDEKTLSVEVVKSEDYFCNNNVNAVVAWGKLYKKELFKSIRYPFGKLHEDEYTTYKLLFSVGVCAFINQPLYFYYKNSDGITKSGWSPRRLDSICALFERSSFFKKNNYNNAYIFSLKHTMSNLWNHKIYIIETENDDYMKEYLPLIKKYMKKVFWLSKRYKLFPFEQYKKYYEFVYPKATKYYKRIKNLYT